jgi:hypothetical protein
MANASYVNNGTALLFNGEAGADVAFSVEGVADAAGRTSAQHDAGAAPRPFLYTWSCEVQWQATPTQYAGLELYIAEAPDHDATQVAGDQGVADAALGDVDSVRNMRLIGVVVSENAAASEKCVASGEFVSYNRYFSIVAVNNGGSTINATDSAFRFDLTPRYIELQ